MHWVRWLLQFAKKESYFRLKQFHFCSILIKSVHKFINVTAYPYCFLNFNTLIHEIELQSFSLRYYRLDKRPKIAKLLHVRGLRRLTSEPCIVNCKVLELPRKNVFTNTIVRYIFFGVGVMYVYFFPIIVQGKCQPQKSQAVV